jgi:GNAT superfamily N-acetyltransferase
VGEGGTPPPGLRVRPAVAADAEAIALMIEELNRDQGEETGHVTAEAVRADGFAAVPPEFRVLLAELDGWPAGYALFHPSWSSEHALRGFYLYDLYVRDAARGRGVGRALVAALAATAKAEGRAFLWWNSKEGNRRAQAFYRDLGAIEEPVKAHALFGQAFEALAAGEEEPRA